MLLLLKPAKNICVDKGQRYLPLRAPTGQIMRPVWTRNNLFEPVCFAAAQAFMTALAFGAAAVGSSLVRFHTKILNVFKQQFNSQMCRLWYSCFTYHQIGRSTRSDQGCLHVHSQRGPCRCAEGAASKGGKQQNAVSHRILELSLDNIQVSHNV